MRQVLRHCMKPFVPYFGNSIQQQFGKIGLCLVSYKRSDCLVARELGMSWLNLNICSNEMGRYFVMKSNTNNVD